MSFKLGDRVRVKTNNIFGPEGDCALGTVVALPENGLYTRVRMDNPKLYTNSVWPGAPFEAAELELVENNS